MSSVSAQSDPITGWHKSLSLYSLAAGVEGLVVLLYYLLLPADPKNALWLGFSAFRWGLILVALGGSAAGLASVVSIRLHPRSFTLFFEGLERFLHTRYGRPLLIYGLAVGFLFSLAMALFGLYKHPSSASYYSLWVHAFPLAIWAALLTLQAGIFLLYAYPPKKTALISKRRVEFIDFARGIAIILTILSHAFSGLNTWVEFGALSPYVRILTRLGNPTFITVTGMMIELVYLRRAEQSGFGVTARRLAARSLLCYGAYLATIGVELFAAYLSPKRALMAGIFMAESDYSNILKFYSVLLLLAIPLVWLRKRYGMAPILIITGLAWVAVLNLDRFTWPATGMGVGSLTALLVGRPQGQSSNSILHSLLFLCIGMGLGQTLREGVSRAFYRRAWVLAGAAALVTAGFVVAVSPAAAMQGFAGDFRINHQPAYYAMGSLAAVLTLILSSWAMRKPGLARLKAFILTIGRDTLWAFAIGNSLVVLIPTYLQTPAWLDVLVSFGLTLLTAAILWLKNGFRGFIQTRPAETG